MEPPLYKNNQAPEKRPDGCNAGLWFERFFYQFDRDWKVGDDKAAWLNNNFNRSSGEKDQLKAHAVQQYQLATRLGGTGNVFTTEYHLVTGMGNPHPVENGLSWHPTLGVPYLSGAAVKGLVRSWLEVWEKESDESRQKEKLLRWFGSTSKNPTEEDYKAVTGDLIFFDAFPIEPVQMNVDIMTPHMGKWYEQGGDIENINNEPEKIPADWHDPTPIPFLVVKKARFLFTIAPRNKQCAKKESAVAVEEVMKALGDSLNYMGAGAKTAVGYGQMTDRGGLDPLIADLTHKDHEEKMQAMSSEQRHIFELQQMFTRDKAIGNNAAGNPTSQKLHNLIEKAESWEQADKGHLADLGEAIYGFVGWGKKPKKTKRKAMLAKLRI
jgi:CRISPR-associated protein Cmr6